MSNYIWKQVEIIRQDMVSVLKDSGFEVMLTPSKLTINRGNEKVVEVNTKSTAPKELVDAASDSLYYHQNIAMMVTAMNAVIYLKGDITDAVKNKAHRGFGLYVKMVDYLRKHPSSRNIPVYSDEELTEEGEKFLNETETEITRPKRFTDIIPDSNPFSNTFQDIHISEVIKEVEPEEPKVVEVNDVTVGKYYNKVMKALNDVAWKYSDIKYKWRYGDGPYQEDTVPCLWFTVKFGGAKYKFNYTLPLQKWAELQYHTEKFVEEHGLDKKITRKLIKTLLVRMGLDYLFSNITILDVVTAKTTKENIRKAREVIESDIGKVYMPYSKYSKIFTHSISNDCTVYIVNR